MPTTWELDPMGPRPTLLDRLPPPTRPPSTTLPSTLRTSTGLASTAMAPPPPVRLAWSTLVDAFEVACLLRCAPLPPGRRRLTRVDEPAAGIEFNRADAAQRMTDLLTVLDVPVLHEVGTFGLRRRYQVHRLRVPEPHRARYTALLDAAWRQGRRELLDQLSPGMSTARPLWRPRLAAAAWRSALLGAGRHVRRHILGVRLSDRDLAAVLVRGATLLDVPARLVPGGSCFVVSVADGPERDRILAAARLTGTGTATGSGPGPGPGPGPGSGSGSGSGFGPEQRMDVRLRVG